MKKIEKYLRDDKGAVTTVVVVTLLFFIIILSTAYMITATLRKSQLKSELIAKEIYERDFENIDEIYDSLSSRVVYGVEIPKGFYYVGGTVNTGLVISDEAKDENKYEGQNAVGAELNGNQYVWIEVPKTTEIYSTAGLNIKEFTDEEYTKIEKDLHAYTSAYGEGVNSIDAYYADSDNASDWFADANAYNTAKKNMLKSVYKNGGFYVGRYETGIAYDDPNGTRDFGEDGYTLHPATQTPVIKANAYPYNWVRRTQAKVLAENMYSGNKTSSLMFGVQWDLVLAFMHNKGGIEESTLTSESTTMGNYCDNLWSITNPSAKYSIDYGASWKTCPKTKETEEAILLTTGADTSFATMNIFDMAGNVWEWTLEVTSLGACTTRGGSYGDYGFISTAAHLGDVTNDSFDYGGFRVSIY